jgi:hypothetical protein
MSTSCVDRRLGGISGTAAALLAMMSVVACGQSPGSGARGPADQAAFMEHTRCLAGDDDATLAPVLGSSAVQNVEPLYATLEGAKACMRSSGARPWSSPPSPA